MRKKPPSAAQLAEVQYDPHTGEFWRVHTGCCRLKNKVPFVTGTLNGQGYIVLSLGGKKYLAHHIAWLLTYGAWPRELDHIDRSRANNRISNLRAVTRSEQMLNRTTFKNQRRYAGVSLDRRCNKYRARIQCDGVSTALGYFITMEEARDAYLAAKESI